MEAPDQDNMAIKMVGIYKYFGPYCALNNVNLNVKKGTMHAILGENGAGKSTLMNILYGMSKPDAGQIFINGKLLDIKHPKIAIENKIGMVHQHFMLVPTFTVAQNIMLGKELTKPFGILDFKKTNCVIEELSEKYNLLINTKKKIENMSVGMQQRVEILKALYREAEILILDEPTAALTPQEVKDLMFTLQALVRHGKTVVIITHKLNEIKQVCDFCTIIRRGKDIDSVNVNKYSEQQLASMMVGYDMDLKINKTKAAPKDVV
ncbi:MAG: ATP-binding cassette domain-containing protein, partial [Oscillospiraceae bacterium]